MGWINIALARLFMRRLIRVVALRRAVVGEIDWWV